MRRTSIALLVLVATGGASCTEAHGELGVYVAPSNGGNPSGGKPDGGVLYVPPVDAGRLPKDVATSPCQPGNFEGTFSCNFALGTSCENNMGMGGFLLTGPVKLTLLATGEFLSVSGATLDAMSGGYTLSGPLSGIVDCRLKKFAGSVDGTYTGPAIPGLPVPTLTGQLSGPLEATYDPRQPALTNGTWCLTATNPGTMRTDPCVDIPSGQPGSCLVGSCKGTWNAVKVPGT